MTREGGIFSSLFLVEFLLFSCYVKRQPLGNCVVTELGNGRKDVLEDIGHVHQEVLWQISLLEDVKPEVENGGAVSSSESQQFELRTNETEEQSSQ